MCQLLETIKWQDGVLKNIDLHNKRMNDARLKLFGVTHRIALEHEITIPETLKKGVYKCRVVYEQHIESIEFIEYKIKPIKTIKLVYDNDINYDYKYLERACFANHLKKIKEDDILIVKSGLISDVSYANIVFYDGKKWITPAKPLLKGTMRKYLLDKQLIKEENIEPKDLQYFQKARLINAMLDLENSSDIEIVNIVI